MKTIQCGNIKLLVLFMVVLVTNFFIVVINAKKRIEYNLVRPDVQFETRDSNPFQRKPVVVVERKEGFVKFKDENGVETFAKVEDFMLKYKRK